MNDLHEMAAMTKQVMGILPGGDCGGHGGCGEKTCAACAEQIVHKKKADLCPACNQQQVTAIAELLGEPTVLIKEQIAFIRCSGSAAGKQRAPRFDTCAQMAEAGFLPGECESGCMGIGSCCEVCKFDAMKAVDGKVSIDTEKCTGCLACMDVCPQNLITMAPKDATNFIPCASGEEEEKTREICGYGCIGCGDCEEACPQQAITVEDHCAVIDYEKCVGCVACTVKCRKKIITDHLHDLTKIKEEVAHVRCKGGSKANEKYTALGLDDCSQVSVLDTNQMGLCGTGCTGLGNCTKVCRYDAIHIVEGTAQVDYEKCVGCMDCKYACPKELIVMVPYRGSKLVPCASKASCEETLKQCEVGCIGCGDCAANCPNGAISIQQGHAVVDSTLCENCNICTYVCPRGVLKEQSVPEYHYMQMDALGIREGE